MPVITNDRTKSPYLSYQGPVIPNYGELERYDKLGSKDTMLGKMFGNYYDKAFIPELSQADQRYYNQGNANAFFSNAFKLGAAVPAGVVGLANVLATLSPAGWGYMAATDQGFFKALNNNPLGQLYHGIKGLAESVSPTFVRDDFNNASFLQQLGRPGELLSANTETFQFLVEMFSTAGVGGALKIGTRAANYLAANKPLYKALTSLEGPNVAKLANTIDKVTLNAVLSSSESAAEATDAYDQQTKKLYQDRLQGLNNLTDDEINAKAEEAAKNVFWENMATLAVTNGAFLSLVNPIFKNTPKLSRDNRYGILFKEGQYELPKHATDKASKFQRFWQDKGYTPGVVTKTLLTNVFTEGLEEDLQYNIQKINELDRTLSSDTSLLGSLGRYAGSVTSLLDFGDPDRVKAVGLGSLIGGGQVGVSMAASAAIPSLAIGPIAESRAYRKNRNDAIDALNKGYTDYYTTNVFKKEADKKGRLFTKEENGEVKYFNELDGAPSEVNAQDYQALTAQYNVDPLQGGQYTIKGQFELDDNGRPIRDPQKFEQFTKDAIKYGELDDMIEQEALRASPDNTKLELLQKEKLSLLAYQGFQAGTTDLLLEKLDSYKTASPEELIAAGIDPDTDIPTMVDSMTNHVKELEKLWLTVQNSTLIASNSEEEHKKNARRKQFLYETGARALTLDSLIRDLDGEFQTKLTALDPDSSLQGVIKDMFDIHYAEKELEKLFAEKASYEARIISSKLNNDIKDAQAEKELAVISEEIEAKLDKFTALYELTDYPLFKQMSQNTKAEELTQLASKKRFMEIAREDLGKTFDKFLHTRTGYEAFKKETEKAFTPQLTFDRGVETLIVSPSLTKKAYDFFESRKTKKLAFKEKVARTEREFYSEYVDDFITWFEANFKQESGESVITLARNLAQLYTDLMQRTPRMYQDSVDKLEALAVELSTMVEELQAPIKIRAQAANATPQDFIGFAELELEGPELDEFFSELKSYKQGTDIKEALGVLYSNPNAFNTLRSLVTKPAPLSTEEELKEQVAVSFLDASNTIKDVSGYNSGEVSSDYTDSVSIEYEIKKLTNLLPIMKEKDKELKTYLEETYAYTIEQLNYILEKVEENKRNRSLKERTENILYAIATLGNVGIDALTGIITQDNPIIQALLEEVDLPTLQMIAETAKTDPVMAAKAIADLTQLATDAIAPILSELKVAHANAIAALYTESFPGQTLTEDEIMSLARSPIRVFKEILAKSIFYEIRNKRFKASDAERFIKDYDLVALTNSRRPTTAAGAPNPDYFDRSKAAMDNAKFDRMLDLYMALLSISKLETHTRSEVSYVSMIQGHIKHGTVQSKAPSPKPVASIGQERVISELVDFLSSPHDPAYEINQNVGVLKAPPGAGKSQVITPLTLRLAGLEPKEVIASATNLGATAGLASAVGATSGLPIDELIAALENNTIDEGIKVILVDELGQANYEKIDRLSKAFSAYSLRNTARAPMKMLFIYDPNQVTAGYKAVPDIEEIGYRLPQNANTPAELQAAKLGNYTLSGSLVFTQNLYDISPISTTYRSDVAQIVDLFNKFATSTAPVADVIAATSVDTRVTTKDVLGTYVEADAKSLSSILAKSITENPNRTRIVIVGNEARKTTLSGDLQSLGIATPVMTVEEVQGQTYDEVYVDVRTTDSPTAYPGLFETPVNYNKYVNTAISRAAKFAYVANVVGSNSVDTNIPAKTLASAETKKVNYEEYVKAKKAELEVLKKLTGNKVTQATPTATSTTDPTDTVEPAEDVDTPEVEVPEAEETPTIPPTHPIYQTDALEEELMQADEMVAEDEAYYEPAVPVHIPVEGEVTFNMSYPDNNAFTDLANSPGLKVGDTLYFVKDTYTPSIRAGYKERILVVRPDGDGLYRMVAVLSDAERPMVEKAMGIDLNKLTPFKFVPQSDYHVAYDGPLSPQDYVSLYAANDISKLTYRYDDGEPTTVFDSEDKIVGTFNMWARTLLGPNYKNIVENYDAIIAEPHKYLYFKVFSSSSKILKFFKGRKAPRVLPLTNVPYLVLDGVKLTTDKQPLTPQFIRSSSVVLNRNHALVQAKDSTGADVALTVKTLNEFTQLIEDFQNELDKSKSLGQYSKVRMGMPYQDGNGSLLKDTNGNYFYVFHALIRALSEQYRSKGTSPIKVLGHGKDNADIKGLSDALKAKFPDIDPTSLSDKLLELAAKLDALQHFGDANAITSGSVKVGAPRNFAGHAQLVLNKLALGNFFLTINEETGATPIILRDYQTNYVANKPTETVSAKRLLGPVTAVRGNKAYNPLIKQSIIKKLHNYAASLEARGRTNSMRFKLVEELLSRIESDSYDVQSTPLTLSQLKAIAEGFDKKTGNYTQINEGFGLRAPVTYYTTGEDDFVKADFRLGTTFKGVVPTRISVSTVKQEAIAAQPKEKPKPTIQQFLQLKGGELNIETLHAAITTNYTQEEIDEFNASMKRDSLFTSLLDYLRSASSTEAIRKLSVTLKKTVKNLVAVLTSSDSTEEALKILYEDPSYWKEDSKSKYGPRDTVRLATLLHLFPEVANDEKLYRMAVYFAQNRWYRKNELQELALDDVNTGARLQGMVDAATKVAKSYGINVSSPKVVDEDGGIQIAYAVEYIAETIGSQVRHAKNSPAAVAIELNEQVWASTLAELVYNQPDQVATYLRQTPEVAAALGITLEGVTDGYITEKATEAVVVNNLQPIRSMKFSQQDIGPLLTDEQVSELYESILPSNRASIISKIFRSRKGEPYRIITLNEMVHSQGKKNWGLYKNGILYFARDPRTDKVGAKVVRHEVMHHIIWGYLTPTDRARLFQLGRVRFGNLPLESLEEKIVESFVNQEYTRPDSFWANIKDILNRILRFLGFTYNNLTSLEAFFNSVDAKYYSGKGRTVSVERNMKIAKDWAIKDDSIQQEHPDYGALEAYTLFEDLLFETFDALYNQRKLEDKAVLVSYEQAIDDTFAYLAAAYNDPSILGSAENASMIKAALAPIVDPNSNARRSVMNEFFPQTREAEKLALAIADLRERYEALYDELSELTQLDVDSQDEDLISEVEAQMEEFKKEIGIKEETFETELRNPSTKLTGRVKQRLSGIEYLHKGSVKRAEFAKVFNVLLAQVSQVDNTDIFEYMDSVLRNMSKRHPIRGGASRQRTIGKALHVFLRNTFEQFVILDREAPKNIAFRKDVSNLVEYAIFSKDLSDVRDVTRTEALLNPAKYGVVDKHEQENLDTFANRLVDSHKFNYDDIRKSYYLYEEVAFINSMVSAVSSLRENVPSVGITFYNWGAKTERYYGIRKSGPNYIVESDILAYTDSFVESMRRGEATTLFSSNEEDFTHLGLVSPNAKGEGFLERKVNAINKFLDLINLNTDKRLTVTGWNPAELDANYESFYYAIQNLNENFRTEASEEDQDIYGEFITLKPAGAILADENSTLRFISDALSEQMSSTDTVSYRRGDGKQAYRYVDASFQSALLYALTSPVKAGLTFEHVTRELDGTLRAEGALVKNNIFVNGNMPAAKILAFVDHDSLKTYGRDEFAKYLRAEKGIDFHMRNFSFGFLSTLRNKKGASYVQFLPIPANRSSIQGAEVSYLNSKQVESAAKRIIRNELTRPEPKKAGLDNNNAYVNNWDKMTFPGLTTDSGFALSRTALMKGRTIDEAVGAAYALYVKHARKQVETIVADMIDSELIIEERNLKYAANKAGTNTDKLSRKELLTVRRKVARGELDPSKLQPAEDLYNAEYLKALTAAVASFYGNFVVNQYSLSNLIYGDSALYNSKEDETKRIQIATATGDMGLVDAQYGMPPTSNVAVMSDLEMGIPMDIEYVRDDSMGEDYKATDGQGYVLPEFYEKMSQAYSIESRLDITLKPVYYAVDANGVVTALKYSLVVLTDELTAKNPFLRNLRDAMRNHTDANGLASPIDQAVFNSAVKVGNPLKKNLSKFDEKSSTITKSNGTKGFDPKSILTINNKFLKIQLNPAKSTDASTSNPSQGTAFINTNGLNVSEAHRLHTLNSQLIELGLKDIMKELEINAKGTLSKNSQLAIRKRLINMTDNLPGAEDINELLSFKQNGKFGVSLDVPLLSKKVTSALSSMVTRATVGFRFPGTKLVLQAEAGISEKLAWKDKDGYTEVILPSSMKDVLRIGDVVTDGLVAFRIPSTNFHSMLALKVVGFYDAPVGSKGNIIIAPSLIVHYHGSDYDIDTLFLMRKREHVGEPVNLKNILMTYDGAYETADYLNFNPNDVYGSKAGTPTDIIDRLYRTLGVMETSLDEMRRQISRTKGDERLENVALIKTMEADYRTVIQYTQYIVQNNIVDLFSSTLRDPKNRRDLLTPITFGRISNNKASLVEELESNIDYYLNMLKTHGEVDSFKHC